MTTREKINGCVSCLGKLFFDGREGLGSKNKGRYSLKLRNKKKLGKQGKKSWKNLVKRDKFINFAELNKARENMAIERRFETSAAIVIPTFDRHISQ